MEEEDWNEALVILEKNAKRKRKHANFFDWIDKETKELNICEYLLQHLEETEGLKISKFTKGEDPPDCILETKDSRIGIEVTELVNQKIIENQINYNLAYAEPYQWTSARFELEINAILSDKDYQIGAYDQYILLVHTDEPLLTVKHFDSLWSETKVIKTNHIDEAYLLFGYIPQYGCAIRKLI